MTTLMCLLEKKVCVKTIRNVVNLQDAIEEEEENEKKNKLKYLRE